MKYIKIVISMMVLSNAAFAMVECEGGIEKENWLSPGFSNAPFSMGAEGNKSSKPRARSNRSQKTTMPDYFPLVSKNSGSMEADVKRARLEVLPLLEIDTNSQRPGDVASYRELTVSNLGAARPDRRDRSDACNFDDSELAEMLTRLGINK